MFFLYDIIVIVAGFFLKLAAPFNPKLKLFADGRKKVIETIRASISDSDRTIWFHAASLGEYEQGLPVIDKFKSEFPNHKIVLSFFSPSGFEVRKNNAVADLTVYLPIDTRANARRFINAVHPEMVFFIKYEYWPNYLKELKKQHIPTYLISGIFRENQVFFQWYGGFFRIALDSFTHFFVQNVKSKELLLQWEYNNVTISGDTRFDRVAQILEKDNSLDFIAEFKNDALLVVVGSSWPKDESFLIQYINESPLSVKFVIAPHNIKENDIESLQKGIHKKTVLFSDRQGKDLSEYDVFIVDTIGILTKVYSYADIAYVGGGFGNPGVHNILEPAAFSVPIVIGPNYSHFAEAKALVKNEGCLSVSNQEELNETFDRLIQNKDERLEKGHICGTFVQMNKNATAIILKYFHHDII